MSHWPLGSRTVGFLLWNYAKAYQKKRYWVIGRHPILTLAITTKIGIKDMRIRKPSAPVMMKRTFKPLEDLSVATMNIATRRRLSKRSEEGMTENREPTELSLVDLLTHDCSIKPGFDRYGEDRYDYKSTRLSHEEHDIVSDYTTLEDVDRYLFSFHIFNPELGEPKAGACIASLASRYPYLFHDKVKHHVIRYNDTFAAEAANTTLSPIFLYEQPNIWVDQPNTLENVPCDQEDPD